MDRDVFAARLAAAAAAARALAARMVAEELPQSLVFRVRLNRSYDGYPPRPGERRFPADGSPERAAMLRRCDAATAVAELWRDGRVPEWIDVAVAGENGVETVVELVCAGRFTDDDQRLYHLREGRPPFHTVSPVLPASSDGTPFSIHARSECWDDADRAHLARVAERVWSLELHTDAFDHDRLRALPDLPRLEIFEHRACALGPGALAAFARFPALRVLRLDLNAPSDFHLDGAGAEPGRALVSLTISNLPPRPWGVEALEASALTTLGLGAGETLWLGGGVGPAVRALSLAAPSIAGPFRLPPGLERLSVSIAGGTDRQVEELLDGVTGLRSVILRGTPVTDAILAVLDRYDLDQLNLVDTAVTAPALSRFRADHPGTACYPRNRPEG